MSTKELLLSFLNENTKLNDEFYSGQKLADMLGVSRNAIWKSIESLKHEGYPIESKAKGGYRLSTTMDLLSSDNISSYIDFNADVMVYSTLPSTNLAAKELQLTSVPSIIVANHQSAGRGRLGRDFYSPKGTGIYMTYAYKPDFDLLQTSLITTATAVAVCQAIEGVAGVSPKIKWVNDLYLKDKKIGGILTEATSNLESGVIDSLVIGIGINCFTEGFPNFARNQAGSISTELGAFQRNKLIGCIVNRLHRLLDTMDKSEILMEYKTRCNTLGKQIKIYRCFDDPEETGVRAKAYDIDDNGGLIVEYLEGPDIRKMETITSGEISIR